MMAGWDGAAVVPEQHPYDGPCVCAVPFYWMAGGISGTAVVGCGSAGDEAAGVAGVDELLVGVVDVGGHVLGDGEAFGGEDFDALRVADEHGEDAVGVADRGGIFQVK